MRLNILLAASLLATIPLTAALPAPMPEAKAGYDAYRQKDYRACAAIFSDVARLYPQDTEAPEMAAACFSRAGDAAKTREYLQMALRRGYRDCKAVRTKPLYAPFVGELAPSCDANEEAFVRSVNPELLAAYSADQWEREQLTTGGEIDVEMIKRHDAARQALVALMLRHGHVRTADDYYHAAMIMQHGSGIESFETAQKLVKKAVQLRPWFPAAQWLYAATTDRLLQAQGKPQIYGTQYRQVGGKWTLEPFDQHAVTDAERVRWRVAPLAERLAFIAELNQ